MELARGVRSMGQGRGSRVRAYLLDDGSGRLTLVDTLFEEDGRLVLDELSAMGRPPSALRHIVLTHAHPAHLGGLAALKRASGATVYAHAWEADIVSGDRRPQSPGALPPAERRLLRFQLRHAFGRSAHAPCAVDVTLEEGDQVGPLLVLETPGHTPGHLSLHWPERRLVIAGDAVVTWPRLAAGWDGFHLNAEQSGRSLRRLAELEPAIVGVGHGDPITKNAAEALRSLLV